MHRKKGASTIYPPGFLKKYFTEVINDSLGTSQITNLDFSAPEGEEAVLSPDSISWRVFRNPLTNYLGAMCGLAMLMTEPRMIAAAYRNGDLGENKEFENTFKRIGSSVLMGVYAPLSQYERHAKKVKTVHKHIRGVTEAGQPFRGDDPELMEWVHNAQTFGFAQAARHYGDLSDNDMDRFYAENAQHVRYMGLENAPSSVDEINTYMNKIYAGEDGYPKPENNPATIRFLQTMNSVSLFPQGVRLLQPVFTRAAVDLMPNHFREIAGLDKRYGLRFGERKLVETIYKMNNRLVIDDHPAIQACKRLGLPDNYLFGPEIGISH